MSEIDALLTERSYYAAAGKKDRVAQVDAEIKRLGGVVVDDAPEAAVADPDVEQATTRKPRPRKATAKPAEG